MFHKHDVRVSHPDDHGVKDDEVVVIHLNARSIVFRDHLKRADKTVRQIEHERDAIELNDDDDDDNDDDDDDSAAHEEGSSRLDDDDDDINEQDDDSSLESDTSDEGGNNTLRERKEREAHAHNSTSSDLRGSIRGSLRGLSKQESTRQLTQYTRIVQEEVKTLAGAMVPDLKHIRNIRNMSERSITIEGFHVVKQVKPLSPLEVKADAEFEPLVHSPSSTIDADNRDKTTTSGATSWTNAERYVVERLETQTACVKTIKNTGSEWSEFLTRFVTAPTQNNVMMQRSKFGPEHYDLAANTKDGLPFTSFFTSTSLLPESGRKMRCYGSLTAYSTGVVFALPTFSNSEEETRIQQQTQTWSWPAGYAAKTEYNIDHGKLINGRQEALVTLQQLREYNHQYVHGKDHYIAGKIIPGGFSVVPYNEVYLRVGGPSRMGMGMKPTKDLPDDPESETGKGIVPPSFDKGCGIPIALFARTFQIQDLVALLRVRERAVHILGEEHARSVPLLVIANDHGVRVFTQTLQQQFWKWLANKVNPFQNPVLVTNLRFGDSKEAALVQKQQELLDLDESCRESLSCEEFCRVAGGFGVKDACIVAVLRVAKELDHKKGFFQKSSRLRDAVMEGFISAIRSNDHHTARQLLILYTIVSSHDTKTGDDRELLCRMESGALLFTDLSILKAEKSSRHPSKLPRPLDTGRIRNSTHSRDLLVVFGAAQTLASLQDGSAKRRAEDSYRAVQEYVASVRFDDLLCRSLFFFPFGYSFFFFFFFFLIEIRRWIEKGKKSMAFRVSSWQQQRGAQSHSLLAAETGSLFTAFISHRAIKNREKFAHRVRKAVEDDCTVDGFLRGIYDVLDGMKHPSLRLELLQYILGLDNRYSIANVRQSVQLAATCMSLLL